VFSSAQPGVALVLSLRVRVRVRVRVSRDVTAEANWRERMHLYGKGREGKGRVWEK